MLRRSKRFYVEVRKRCGGGAIGSPYRGLGGAEEEQGVSLGGSGFAEEEQEGPLEGSRNY